jgi:hypothetical protein
MNRRGFLKFLGGSAVALSAGGIALLEQEVWTPTKTIVLPPKGGWVAGTYGYSRYEGNGYFPSHGALAGYGREYPTMAAVMRAAMEQREEYGSEFVVWQKPAGQPGRKVIYYSCH